MSAVSPDAAEEQSAQPRPVDATKSAASASESAGQGDGPGAPLRLMAVHAHPDDESSKGAATMAKYAADGVEVLVCTMTGGEWGSILNPAMDRPEVLANL